MIFSIKIISSQNFYETDKEAHEDLLLGRIWGYMIIPSYFTPYLFLRSIKTKQFSTNQTFLGSQIDLEVDASSKQITLTYIKTISDAFQEFSRGLLQSCGVDRRAADLPLKYVTPAYGDFASAFRDFWLQVW